MMILIFGIRYSSQAFPSILLRSDHFLELKKRKKVSLLLSDVSSKSAIPV
jgi:hypothetical protein